MSMSDQKIKESLLDYIRLDGKKDSSYNQYYKRD